MQHLDEGMIHAWLDGALPPDEGARVEEHARACDVCAAAVADARGLVAGASRIVAALDTVPGDVIPRIPSRSTVAAPDLADARRSSIAPRDRSLWARMHLTPARAGLAATLLVAVASLLTVRHGAGDGQRPSVPPVISGSNAAPAPAASTDSTAATPGRVAAAPTTRTPPPGSAREKRALDPAPAVAPSPNAPSPNAPSPNAVVATTAARSAPGAGASPARATNVATSDAKRMAPLGVDSAAKSIVPTSSAMPRDALKVAETHSAGAALSADSAARGAPAPAVTPPPRNSAESLRAHDIDPATAAPRGREARRLQLAGVTSTAAAAQFAPCYQVVADSAATRFPALPARFAFSVADTINHAIHAVDEDGRVGSALISATWRLLAPGMVRLDFPPLPPGQSTSLSMIAGHAAAQASSAGETRFLTLAPIDCRE